MKNTKLHVPRYDHLKVTCIYARVLLTSYFLCMLGGDFINEDGTGVFSIYGGDKASFEVSFIAFEAEVKPIRSPLTFIFASLG